MGLQDVGDDGKINGYDPSTTLADLVDEHNKVIVERAVGYMDSLEQADEKYRESTTDMEMEEYERHSSEGLSGGEVTESSVISEAGSEWAKRMKEEGIGIDE